MNQQIEVYPYFSLLNNVIMNLPLHLTYEECTQLAKFLNEYKGIVKIEYLELVKLIDDTKFKSKNTTQNTVFSNDIPSSPKFVKLLRSSRYYPFYTILRKVSELPTDLSFLELQRLADYLNVHENILSTTYEDLCKLTCIVTPKQSSISCEETLTTNDKCQVDSSVTDTTPHTSNFTFETPYESEKIDLSCLIKVNELPDESNSEKNDLSCLKKVSDLPEDLEDEEYQRLASYLSLHPEIWKINYFDLLNRAEPRSPKRRRISKPKLNSPYVK